MPKPRVERVWTEQVLRTLDANEYDYQEFKSSQYMVLNKTINSDFHLGLSKQISAFANGAGGLLFIGIDDEGNIDGGVSTSLKGGGTRAWLEDIVSGLVMPKLRNYNVFEVLPASFDSAINEGCAVYIVDIKESLDAPHQARDKRYYLRIAGKSRPMDHVHIQDVIRRTHNPKMHLSRFSPYGEPELDREDARGPRVFLQFQMCFINNSRTLAKHVGAEVIIPRQFVGKEVKRRILSRGDIAFTQRSGDIAFFRYHPNPVFPGQELVFLRFWIGVHTNNIGKLKSLAVIRWRIYADDAEPVEGETSLLQYVQVQKTLELLRTQANSGK